ncbi:secreted RxLR effector protein 161-like [Bidens hawaiensis]|uniref:secreted RxLR effector protein 161-like n=1 Tax=Bidens hawaiensis TaxID=980011 RepID=UPI00404A08A5
MSDPRSEHLLLAKRSLRYAKETYMFGLMYQRNSNAKLQVFTDNDYARDIEDRKCTSGYVCVLSKAEILWSSRKQGIVTLSLTEDEYVATTTFACHTMWLKELLEEINGEEVETIDIMCENSSMIKLSKNPVQHKRTKHIDVRFHYLRNLVNEEKVQLEFFLSKDQVADIIIKPMKLEVFEKMRKMIEVQDLDD